MILHCMKKSVWEGLKEKEYWGQQYLEEEGFIHCSAVDYFYQVAPYFENIEDELVLIGIDENKLTASIDYGEEDHIKAYPHILGLINKSAVIQVFPFLRDKQGH